MLIVRLEHRTSIAQCHRIPLLPYSIRKHHVQADSLSSEFCSSLAASLLSPAAWAQSPGSGGQGGPKRRPFAKAGTPRQAERIRYFDVKHIKAELTLDTKKREVRGTVTHTLSPLHPYLTRVELDCGSELKVTKVTVGTKAATCAFTTKDGKLSITLDKAYGPGDTLDLAIEYSGSPEHGLHFVLTGPGLSREAALDLDPGRVRGHAPLAPLLRLSQRPRHQRDDHHGREAPVRRLQRVLVETKQNDSEHHDLPLEDGRAPRQLPDLAGRGRFRRLSRQGRRPAAGLLCRQARRRGDRPAVHGQDARR